MTHPRKNILPLECFKIMDFGKYTGIKKIYTIVLSKRILKQYFKL